jgi:predicted GTPase
MSNYVYQSSAVVFPSSEKEKLNSAPYNWEQEYKNAISQRGNNLANINNNTIIEQIKKERENPEKIKSNSNKKQQLYKKNQKIWYLNKNSNNSNNSNNSKPLNGKILAYHSIDNVYSILLDDGREIQTIPENLSMTCPINNNIELLIDTSDEEEKKEVVKNKIPKENINICFVGGVSTGKSTILNAIFCEQLTQCKIKRTTMVPTVYIENNNTWNPFDKDQQTEAIFKKISEKNQEIIELTENGHKLKKEDYSELAFNVGKLDINILPESFVNVYDIPGLNDARTKDVYYEYLDENFYKFNLVIFLVDIHSGLNTSDEMEIVNFIANRTKDQLENNKRKIYTLIVVNKADDMRLDEDSNETDKLELTGELSEMYDQVEKTITDEFKRKNVLQQLIGIIPLCAIDAYLYRMVKKHGSNFKLSPEQILKIGVNEHGKRFSTLKPAIQEKKVYEILGDKAFIETMIKLSGFSCFEKMLAKFLNENDTGKQIRIDNLLYDLRKLPSLKMFRFSEKDLTNINDFKNLVKQYCDIYSKIKQIDINMYKEHMTNILMQILSILEVKIKNTNLKEMCISELLVNFNTYKTIIIEEYFNEFENIIHEEFCSNSYPLYLIKHIISGIHNKFNTERVDIIKIYDMFNIIDTIGSLNKEIVNELLDGLITNSYERNTITFEENTDIKSLNLLITMLTKFQSLDIDLTRFLRFLLINRHISYRFSEKILWNKMLSYQKRGEVAISNWIRCTGSTLYFNTGLDEIDIFINWQPDDGLDDLDLFYLNYTA